MFPIDMKVNVVMVNGHFSSYSIFRASESNIQPISSQIENLYLTNSRADLNETLISLMFELCVTSVLTPERLAMELMMLVAILHGNVGSEVGK